MDYENLKCKKYGKQVDFYSLNRNIETLTNYAKNARGGGEKYFKTAEIDTKCRICGSVNIHKYVTINSCYKYLECENCKAIVLGNLPNIQEMYEGNDSEKNIYLDDRLFEKRVDMITRPKIDFALENCPDIHSWLDIGCGVGEALWCLKPKMKALGIESDKAEVAFARGKDLNVLEGYITPDCSDSKIVDAIKESDVISFFNVIEHVEKPTEFIDYIYQKSGNGSYIVFDTPKHPSMASFVNYMFRGQVHRHMVPPFHLQIFSIESIEFMLRGKYEIIAMWEYGQGYTDLLNNAMLATGTDENRLYYDLLNMSDQVEKVLDENHMGDQILVIAKRIGDRKNESDNCYTPTGRIERDPEEKCTADER